jgi:hypothetical protein
MSFDQTRSDLNKQSVAAASLVAELKSEDAQLNHDMIEGETGFFEAVEAALSEIDECEILAAGLADHIKTMQDRLSRVKGRADRVRGMIDQAFHLAEVKSHRFASATITLKAIPQKLVVVDESQIPSRFFTPQPPKLDKKALAEAVKAGDVPGAHLSNGGSTIQIRRA